MMPEQGSDEWHNLRRSKITATDSICIMGLSPWTTIQELWEEKMQIRPPKKINSAMQRGMILEPKARKLFEEKTGLLMVPDVRIHEQEQWLLASLDGISMDGKEILEIKCTNKKNHALAKTGQIPEYYYPQVQHQIFVCGVDRCHYCSFDGTDIVVVLVYRDNNFIASMIKKEYAFYNCMITLKEPK
jgi:putative phage-type endonuclease